MITIKDERKNKKKAFPDLNIGDFFIYDGNLYVKVDDDDYNPRGIFLANNMMIDFYDYSEVEPVDVEVVIK